jgi:5-methylcytosine-specific restriction endonuclease McrA
MREYNRRYARPTYTSCGKCSCEMPPQAHSLCAACVRKNGRAHYADHRERYLQRNKTHYENNKDYYQDKYVRRRSLKLECCVGDVDLSLILAEGRCRHCGSEDDLHVDHIIPLSRKGPHTQLNLQPLCGLCNRRKGAKTMEEFISEYGGGETNSRLQAADPGGRGL